MVPPLDESQQVLTQDLENHTDVHAIGSLVLEGIQQTDDVFPTRVRGLCLDDLAQELDFVDRRLGVVGGGANDLQCDVFTGGRIPRQPDGGEVTPTQLAHDHIALVVVGFADRDRMISTLAIIFGVLFLGGGFQLFAG